MGDEPLPGYRLIAPLGMGGFGEVWKCSAPGGLHKAIKFVHEDKDDRNSAEPTSLEQEYEAFERVKSIRHPFLLTLERVERAGDELVMVMELADQSLGNRYDDCRAAGLPGIPRRELLSYMVDAAEALDVLGWQHGLQHLDVKPANLFILGGHVKVGDYGLVARHRTSQNADEPKLDRGLTPKYVAPEILCDRVDARSDQYPLALVYQELLTGVFPYSGRTARQLLMQHSSAEPDLNPLPAKDRAAVRRALAKDPTRRFPSCLSFVKALLREDPTGGTQLLAATTRMLPTPPHGSPQPAPKQSGLIRPAVRQIGSTLAEATVRLSPSLAAMIETRAVSQSELDFNRQHPIWKYQGEIRSTERGRVVRASDAGGELLEVHMVKLPSTGVAECAPIIAGLFELGADVAQSVIRPHPQALSFAVPERYPSMKDWLAKRTPAGEHLPGRAAIRAMLGPIAAVLDSLHARHQFPHALLSNTTVLQIDPGWGIALYGMGELLRRTRSDQDWIAGESHAAPEAIAGRAVPASDQYSLALLFLELCGAWQPGERRATRADRGTEAVRFDRHPLLTGELAAVKKALAVDPAHRFPSCAAFLDALAPPPSLGVVLEEVRMVESAERLSGRSAAATAPPRPDRLADAILLAAGAQSVASWPSPKLECLVIRLPDGRLTCRFPVKITSELAMLKLAAFQDQHGHEMVQWTADTFVLKPRPGPKGVELVVQLARKDQAGAGEIAVAARATGGSNAYEAAIGLIEQFRRAVQNTNERRRASRFRTDLPMLLFPVDGDLAVQAALTAKCIDVSATGFACRIHGVLATEHVFATFPGIPELLPWALLAKVVRGQPGPVGCRFVHAGS